MGVGIVGDTRICHRRRRPLHHFFGDLACAAQWRSGLPCAARAVISIIHPTAYVVRPLRVGHGCVIGPFANVGSYVHLEDHVLLNLYSAAGHDARIGAFCVFSPYSVANGGSWLDDGVFLGTHATVTPNVRVGAGSKVAAGAVVYRDVREQSLAAGNPARMFPINQADSPRQVDPGARVGALDDPHSS
jgi:acetyltransferase-like isoleucine patch superfamily enzyme